MAAQGGLYNQAAPPGMSPLEISLQYPDHVKGRDLPLGLPIRDICRMFSPASLREDPRDWSSASDLYLEEDSFEPDHASTYRELQVSDQETARRTYTSIRKDECLRMDMMFQLADRATLAARQKRYRAVESPSFVPTCTKLQIDEAIYFINSGDLSGAHTDRERMLFLLTMATPIIAFLEQQAKRQIEAGVGSSQKTQDLAYQTLVFWAPLLSLTLFEHLAARAADAALIITEPQIYHDCADVIYRTIFDVRQGDERLNALHLLLPHEFETLLFDRRNNNSFASLLRQGLIDQGAESIVVPKEIAMDIILDRVPGTIPNFTDDLKRQLNELAANVGSGTTTLEAARQTIRNLGGDDSLLEMTINMRLKSMLKVIQKHNRRSGGVPLTARDPQTSKDKLHRLTAVKMNNRPIHISMGTVIPNDILGVRILADYLIAENDGKKLGTLLGGCRFGQTLEVDVERLRSPRRKEWPAAHFLVLLSLPVSILVGGRLVSLTMNGATEIQFIGRDFAQRSPARHASAATVAYVQETTLIVDGGRSVTVPTQSLREPGTGYDVLARLYAQIPPPRPDFISFILHTDLLLARDDRYHMDSAHRCPLDGSFPPALYHFMLAEEKLSDPSPADRDGPRRFDELVRSVTTSRNDTFQRILQTWMTAWEPGNPFYPPLYSPTEFFAIILRAWKIRDTQNGEIPPERVLAIMLALNELRPNLVRNRQIDGKIFPAFLQECEHRAKSGDITQDDCFTLARLFITLYAEMNLPEDLLRDCYVRAQQILEHTKLRPRRRG